jgi:CrcB protein
MTVLALLGVGLAGGVGAVFRFLLDGRVAARIKGAIPYGTLVVNLSGATVLGLVSGLAPNPLLSLIIGTGAIGGYTTFSTWMFESHRLGEDGQLGYASRNVLVTLSAGLLCMALGYSLGGAL